jgi:hypothetical protein
MNKVERIRHVIQFKYVPLTGMLVVSTVLVGQQDRPGLKDPPVFNRPPHYFLTEGGAFEDKHFDGFEFRVKKGNSWEPQRVEGHWTRSLYSFDGSSAAVSSVQTMGRTIGGECHERRLLSSHTPYTLVTKKHYCD